MYQSIVEEVLRIDQNAKIAKIDFWLLFVKAVAVLITLRFKETASKEEIVFRVPVKALLFTEGLKYYKFDKVWYQCKGKDSIPMPRVDVVQEAIDLMMGDLGKDEVLVYACRSRAFWPCFQNWGRERHSIRDLKWHSSSI